MGKNIDEWKINLKSLPLFYFLFLKLKISCLYKNEKIATVKRHREELAELA